MTLPQDAGIRVDDFAHPHVRGTMSELLAGINDPNQCRFTLDLPLTHRAMPPSIRYMTSYHSLDIYHVHAVCSTTVLPSDGAKLNTTRAFSNARCRRTTWLPDPGVWCIKQSLLPSQQYPSTSSSMSPPSRLLSYHTRSPPHHFSPYR